MRKSCLVFFMCLAATFAPSQSLKLINKLTQTDITNTSITLQAEDPKDWKGAESIDLYAVVENKSNKTIQVGAKKLELQPLSKEIEHTFCFAGNCYDVPTFVSPFNVHLASGKKDSSFLAHFLYDNTKHVRGAYKVKYVFFDTLNLTDSVFVEVTYNSKFKSAAIGNAPLDIVTIEQNSLMFTDNREHQVAFYTIAGQMIYKARVFEKMDLPKLNTGLVLLRVDDRVLRLFIE